jgi:peptidyl-prolyl cis-trans isomerase C
MKKNYFLLALLIVLLPLWSCGEWSGGLPDDVVARINKESVTLDEFNREFKESVLEPENAVRGVDLGKRKQAYLDQIIERKILVQEARRLGMTLSREELSRAISEIKKDYPDEGFNKKLDVEGIALEEWEGRLGEKLLAEKMIRNALRYRGQISEKEAFEYYENHRPSFQLKQRVRVRQIIVADGEEAIQILKRLKKGEAFEKLAAEKSLGPEKVEGGDLGCFSQGERPPEFDHVFTMEVGTISEVIKSPYGYHIFKVEEKSEPRSISFEEAKTGILQELAQQRGEEEYQRWLKDLKEKANVKVNKKLLRS